MEENKVTVETGAEENQEVKTYTQEEVDKLLQQETDRRVTSALKKQQQKFENERAEAEKLRDMDEAQKKEYEFQKRVAELEAKVKASIESLYPIALIDPIKVEDEIKKEEKFLEDFKGEVDFVLSESNSLTYIEITD